MARQPSWTKSAPRQLIVAPGADSQQRKQQAFCFGRYTAALPPHEPFPAGIRTSQPVPASNLFAADARMMDDMILEHAVLDVRPGQTDDFEDAFSQARAIICAMPGFQRLTLSRCLERPDSYLLLVQWDTLEDHTRGFRQSPEYNEWRQRLHHFYDPFPTVEHYREVVSG